MLNVILCDDDLSIVNLVKDFLENYSMMERLEVHIELATTDPLEVLDLFRINVEYTGGRIAQVQRPLKHRLLCLGDLEANRKLDSITLGGEIRKFDDGVDIAFLTHNRLLMPDVFKYRIAPIAFLNKPFIDEDKEMLQSEMIGLLDHAYKRMAKSRVDRTMVEFKLGTHRIYTNLAEICYIKGNELRGKEIKGDIDGEIKSALTVLHGFGKRQYLKRSLSYYDKQIPELLKLGKSYLINRLHVKEIITSKRHATFTMTNGDKIRVMRESFNKYENLINEMRAAKLVH